MCKSSCCIKQSWWIASIWRWIPPSYSCLHQVVLRREGLTNKLFQVDNCSTTSQHSTRVTVSEKLLRVVTSPCFSNVSLRLVQLMGSLAMLCQQKQFLLSSIAHYLSWGVERWLVSDTRANFQLSWDWKLINICLIWVPCWEALTKDLNDCSLLWRVSVT